MGRSSKIECMFCDKKIVAGVSFCEHCGRPTQWASHDERVDWEVSQWRHTRAEAPVPAMAAARPARSKKASVEAPHRPTPPARRSRERAPEPAVATAAQHDEMYVPQPSRPSSYAERRSSRVAPEPGGAPKAERAPEPVAEPAARVEVEPKQEVHSNGHAPAAQANGAIVGAKKGASLFSRLKRVSAPAPTPEDDGRVVRLEDVEQKRAAARTEPTSEVIDISDRPASSRGAKKPVKEAAKKPPTQKAMLEQALDMLGTLEGRMAAVESHLRSMAQDRPTPRRIFRRRAQ